MEKSILLTITISIIITFECLCQKGVIIEGVVKNSEEEYVTLIHQSRMRGNLNFDTFRSIGTYLDKEGHFLLKGKNITDAARYGLEFPEHFISLNLFDGDSLYMDIDFEDINNAFAMGKGAGKINVLNLAQFQYEYFDLEKDRNFSEYGLYIDSVISERLNILEAIFLKQIDNSLVTKDSNIRGIIERTPLNSDEYKFLRKLIKFQRYGLVTNYLSKRNAETQFDFKLIPFTSKNFKYFDEKEYAQLDNLNDWSFSNNLESILQIEYLKEKQIKDGLKITFSNWRELLRNQEYGKWIPSFLKDNFKKSIYTQYYGEAVTGLMTWGMDYKPSLNKLNMDERNKYIRRIKTYEELLTKGLSNEEYRLNQEHKYLNEERFQNLLKSYKNTPLLIVFWSAQAAGADLINKLPAMREFENNNKKKIDVIYICIDKEENKNMWAARVIDESWKAKHYFMPIEGNSTTLKECSNKNITTLCSGGASYTYIDKKGSFNNQIQAPFKIKRGELTKVYN